VNLRRSALDLAGGLLHGSGIFRLLHTHLLPGNVSVLMYHGLIRVPLPVPEPCFLSVDRFARQMEYLARNFDVVHVDEALACPGYHTGRPRACVTFDDGFVSVQDLALPILQRLRIPATVYLVTDLIDSGQTVWFARLHQAICETVATKVTLGELCFSLEGQAARANAAAGLQRALKPLNRAEFSSALGDVFGQLGAGEAKRAMLWEPFQILSSNQIRHMSEESLVRFGAHTATHQILTRTTPEGARREIERSVAAVASLVGHPSRSFAYPNGGPDDFDATAIEAIRGVGIDYAVTTIPGPVGSDTNPYAIPRYNIGDHPLARFAGVVHHARHSIEKITRNLSKNR
jgi:peptidoglycan/xylan/chitin deacetylase (PgdA/CDA1 family)